MSPTLTEIGAGIAYEKIINIDTFLFFVVGLSKEDALLDASLDYNGDVSNVDDLADMQSSDLFDDYEGIKNTVFNMKRKQPAKMTYAVGRSLEDVVEAGW